MAKKAKKAKETFALKRGHATAYRRTIHYSENESAQLVFEPGKPQDLADCEIEQCQDLLDCGLLVKVSVEGDRILYAKGETVDSTAIVERLEKKVEDLSAELAELREENAGLREELGILNDPEEEGDGDPDDEAATTGDE